MKKSISGFTIVELLIVIVVIAILAAISIVAYSGIQTRASNTTTMSGITEYTNLFQIYAADNGQYPDTYGQWPCLDADAGSGCGRVSGGSGCGFSGLAPNSSAFFNQLSGYTSQMPTVSSQTMTCSGTEVYRGAYAENNSANTKDLILSVFLKGDTACPSSAGSAIMISRWQNDMTTKCRYGMPAL